MSPILLYGATGCTGQLAAEHAVARGLRPILTARNADKLQPFARRLGLEARGFDLTSPAAIQDGIKGASVVLHMAGPFSATSRPMADITGEIAVCKAQFARDGEARAAGVMLLPGEGFDVVPSDCLAAHVKGRLPGATRLRLSIGGLGQVSRGTAKTMLESLGRGTLVRHGGQVVELQTAPRGTADFGAGPTPTVGVSWGDVSTDWHSTHIADIEVYSESSFQLERAAALPRFLMRLLAKGFAQRLINRQIEHRLAPGPTPEQRARSRSVLVAEAWDAAEAHAISRLEVVEGYTLTAWAAVEIARRAAIGDAPIGFQTPSSAFGADFILSFDGTTRLDLRRPSTCTPGSVPASHIPTQTPCQTGNKLAHALLIVPNG